MGSSHGRNSAWTRQIPPPRQRRKFLARALALQLRSPFYVGSAGFGLMCASPEGPCDDVGGPDASLRKTNSDAPDFLN